MLYININTQDKKSRTKKESLMSTKVKIKIGSVEVEFEGSEEFLKSELMTLVSSISDIYKAVPADISAPPPSFHIPNEQEEQKTIIQWSTDTIASKLSCKTGPDLVIAACAHLMFVAGKKSFTRKEIHEKMKTATAHYKDSFSGGNLTRYFKSLIKKGTLNELAGKTYALSQKTLTELRQRLAIK